MLDRNKKSSETYRATTVINGNCYFSTYYFGGINFCSMFFVWECEKMNEMEIKVLHESNRIIRITDNDIVYSIYKQYMGLT